MCYDVFEQSSAEDAVVELKFQIGRYEEFCEWSKTYTIKGQITGLLKM